MREAVEEIGFTIEEEYGLVGKVKDFEKWLESQSSRVKEEYYSLKKYMPSSWLMAFYPILYPEVAAEVLLICSKKDRKKRGGFDL